MYIRFAKIKKCVRIQKGSFPSELLQIVRTAQKGLYVGKYEVLSGEASRKRRLSGF